MATEILKLTAQIVISHASMSELTPRELVEELKDVYQLLSSLEGGLILPEEMAGERGLEAEIVKKPTIPLQDIVKEKYGLNPLLVCYNHSFNTSLGLRNLTNLIEKLDRRRPQVLIDVTLVEISREDALIKTQNS